MGFAIFAPSLVILLLTLQWGGNTFRWDSSQIIGLFCGSGATFIIFLIWNWHKGYASYFNHPQTDCLDEYRDVRIIYG